MREAAREKQLLAWEKIKNAWQIAKLLLTSLSPFACGTLSRSPQFSYHDHEWGGVPAPAVSLGNGMVVRYDASKHGLIQEFVKEGEPIPYNLKSTDGQPAIHRHTGRSLVGAYEYVYEEVK